MAEFTPEAFKKELLSILTYWEKYGPDLEKGGFYGRVNYENQAVKDSERSVVLTGRILWTYSLAHRLFKEAKYLTLADRAYQQLVKYFFDPEHGGVYWSVKADGTPLETKKQIYGNAFAMYGLSEYYRVTHYQPALDKAKELFNVIEKYAFDKVNGGYREAFGRDWSKTDDYILSKSPWIKSMNTHLHLVEAYANLYSVWPDPKLKKQTSDMLEAIITRIVNPQTNSMELFFDEKWIPKDHIVSYGHDIEASWLLFETAEILHDERLIEKLKKVSIAMADSASKGLAADGALNYEYDPATKHLQTDRSWWVLAEQMVGFYNAYQLTKDEQYKVKAERSWDYIVEKFVDHDKGEWYGTVKADGTPVKGDKINFWKCPYHNSRACAEMLRRVSKS
ncbi:AGE family epimerase/isomerase [Dyadobacter fanqingshengii]|uniref:Cellobiose 2-epimerase n=1 Tax=Dyadobacter fanqingshengii TaxID=2906443 RepID=A0A9X1PBS5_9BACT|nr:AGE family epimerase/isomerase [Dyadobacter fanqingshengii]MCF0041627.1 AGE family epimerase/isomerase [Dyadobacter fanqingshengii]USJ36656.1 AGE family epimerase/isomerase [Dyadobacter fanqingshengii]